MTRYGNLKSKLRFILLASCNGSFDLSTRVVGLRLRTLVPTGGSLIRCMQVSAHLY
jgi:hypothetical protein